MIMQWMEFGCETMLLAEMPEARQHFFLFFPIFYLLPCVPPLAALPAMAGEPHFLAEWAKACQYFF
jgi:hypothetical protein